MKGKNRYLICLALIPAPALLTWTLISCFGTELFLKTCTVCFVGAAALIWSVVFEEHFLVNKTVVNSLIGTSVGYAILVIAPIGSLQIIFSAALAFLYFSISSSAIVLSKKTIDPYRRGAWLVAARICLFMGLLTLLSTSCPQWTALTHHKIIIIQAYVFAESLILLRQKSRGS
jgi:hypothetical protein